MRPFTKGLLVGCVPVAILAIYVNFGFSSYGGDGSYGPSTLRRHAEGFGLTNVRLDTIPWLRPMCDMEPCYGFTANSGDRHVFGFVWRDSLGIIDIKFCSPDGAWPGTNQGECPYGEDAAAWRKKHGVKMGDSDEPWLRF
jgi:hypothetical protein